MKKLLLLLALCGASSLTFAQDFGKTLISGSINYHQEKHDSNSDFFHPIKESTFSFNPKLGFFLSPNLALGVLAGYARSSNSFISRGYSYNDGYTFFPFKEI